MYLTTDAKETGHEYDLFRVIFNTNTNAKLYHVLIQIRIVGCKYGTNTFVFVFVPYPCISNSNLPRQIRNVLNYEYLIDTRMFKCSEALTFSVSDVVSEVLNPNFDSDPCSIKGFFLQKDLPQAYHKALKIARGYSREDKRK